MKLGEWNRLQIARGLDFGLILEDHNEEEVLLPTKYVPEDAEIGDFIEVFIYKDSEDRPIATTLKPAITLHGFALLEVAMVSNVGAFLDWGLEKHLLVPFKEQKKKMEQGRSYLVYMYIDEKTDRLVASAKIEKFLDNEDVDLQERDKVDLIIANETDLGYNVVISNQYLGLVFKNEVFGEISLGEKRTGYIKKIRPDNKIDVSLQPLGYENVKSVTDVILEQLKENDGFLALNDKSSPEMITAMFNMSKKTFKKAIGALYKQKLIAFENDGIRLKS